MFPSAEWFWHSLFEGAVIHRNGFFNCNPIMPQQLLNAGIQGLVKRLWPLKHHLGLVLLWGNNLFKGIQEYGKVFSLHQKLVDLIEGIIRERFSGPGNDE